MLSVIILIIILIVLFLIGVFFIFVLGVSANSFIKGDKTVSYFFLSVFLFFGAFAGLLLLNKNTPTQSFTNDEVKEILRKEKIILNDSILVRSHKYENDLYFYRLQFKVEISDNDYKRLSNKGLHEEYILQDYTKEGIQIHDTLKINITKDNILHFYKCQYDTNN